ncbi:OprO/OprP family phosphate-selective porin [Caulobacter segnis]
MRGGQVALSHGAVLHPKFTSLVALGAAGACLLSSPSFAQDALSSEEIAALRAEIAGLKAQVQRMESRLDAASGIQRTAPAAPVAPAPAKPASAEITWKGSPVISASGGRSFKAKGRIQTDVGYVDAPKALADRGLGYAAEMRRIRLGGEGGLGAGIGYKLELELSDNAVDLVDTFVTYKAGPWLLALGNQNQFQSLDELTGDTSGSVMERAAFTDAFNFERRLGLSAQYEKGSWLVQAGLFADDITALANASDGPAGGDENNSYGLDGRVVYAPKIGKTQWHFGGSAHQRQLKRVSDTATRYRQRPYVHTSNSRLIGTAALPVREEIHYGLEAAFVRGRWHGAAETHWLDAQLKTGPNARFFGGYAELGYFLTDDTRGYKSGIFDRAKPKKPLGGGGLGTLQVNVRYDYLDLNDRSIVGGTQNAWLAALIWQPVEFLRFNLNGGILAYTDATPLPNGDRDYTAKVAGARMELDF